ncbi:hypothetical protein [uncultured Salipiger sp.]|uniref:hypothetical protein n=1 Tax=uncultured Salipiger sp. TaxID=499810 RepID=UPI002594038B|nr:hypothetical protein [uncultured Salipiger sp.]
MPIVPANDPIPRARVTVTDDMLVSFSRTATKAISGDSLDEDGAALLLALAGPIAYELQQRRAAMATARDLFDLDNVLFMPGS